MITLGNSAFKPYYRDAQVIETTAESKACQSALSESPENPMDLLTQLSLLANLKNQLDPATLSQLGDLQETVQSAAAILQQLGVTLPPPPPLAIPSSIEQLIAAHNATNQTILTPGCPQAVLGASTSTPQSSSGGSVPPTAPPSVTPSMNDENGKNKRKRTTFTNVQQAQLEREYEQDQYMPRSRRLAVADALRLTESQVKTWFQNRRAKDKKTNRITDPTPPITSQQMAGVSDRQAAPTTNQPPGGVALPNHSLPRSPPTLTIPRIPSSFPAINNGDLYGSALSTPSSMAQTPGLTGISSLPSPYPQQQQTRPNEFLPQLPELNAFSYNQLGLNGLNLAQIQPSLSTDLYSTFGYPRGTNPVLSPQYSTISQISNLPIDRSNLFVNQLDNDSSATAITPPMQQMN
ncbi:unnamed protein product, partial [Mesorhabditis belari]|uniref:Homeobox domain-containing protein n=1 Tax=Mesorhabditis belari TaxID=2138241 RepID=A0AAF3JA64_9BILA